MMKIIFFVFFMFFMLLKDNLMMMFYYNLFYLMSFFMIYMYMNFNFWYLSMYFGMDSYSCILMMLSFWILGASIMSVSESYNLKSKLFMFILIMLVLIFFFMSMNLLLFYLFFEISLIPMFFLICYWGMNIERIMASYYLLMYMMVISLPLLIYIYKLYYYLNSFSFLLMNLLMLNYKMGLMEYMFIFGTFYIKLPIYIFHIWLPKAHVEAPVYGSMILAAILLKMGGYGILRLFMVFYYQSMKFNYLIFSVSIVGSFVVSILCLTQVDLKSLVAYSSVVHMNFMLCSLLTLFKLGFVGGFIMMISHGLCSSGLFYLVNMFYVRTFSRLMFLNKGMVNFIPSVMFWWFYLCACNFSFPFSMNFLSEIFIISSILMWMENMMIYMMMICFFSSVYSLYLFSYIYHGEMFIQVKFNMLGFVKEYLVLMIHSIPLFFMLLNMSYFN